ncbi:MAG: hypothetical protein A3J79_01680 [Elusimicrobia bacterium RIFOXYB2_FULL_62_6]|nr:MAG: hypothetical protein A3J79_01680 [Elusimicrobia bacterium RIFOXYB2_FULL_62_6]
MKTPLIIAVLLAAAFSPVAAGNLENRADAVALSFSSLSAPALAGIKVTAPVPAPVRAAQNWADAAKAAYERELEAGGLTDFADILELPPGARRQLEKEWQTLPQGPGNSSEAFKLAAAGRTAFVVQSYIYSDSLRVYIFNAAGVLVAYGEGSIEKDLAWLPLPV